MSSFVLRGGLVVGPTSSEVGDVVIDDGRIAEVGHDADAPSGARMINAEGCWVGPGFVDLHTHLREPGREEAETIESGARAGALGGYSALVAMPNTEPALDTPALVVLRARARRDHAARHRRRRRDHPGTSWRAAGADGRDGGARRAALHRRRHRGPGPVSHAPGPRATPSRSACDWRSTARTSSSPPAG